jgi:hypothetical protein
MLGEFDHRIGQQYQCPAGATILICAPTGRAAKRMAVEMDKRAGNYSGMAQP